MNTRNIQASFKTRNIFCCETEVKQSEVDRRACCDGVSGAAFCLCGITSLIATGGLFTPYASLCIAAGGLSLASAFRLQRDGRNAALRMFEEPVYAPMHQSMEQPQPSAPMMGPSYRLN